MIGSLNRFLFLTHWNAPSAIQGSQKMFLVVKLCAVRLGLGI